MSLRELLRVVSNRWLSVVSMLAIGVGAAIAVIASTTPLFTASTTLYIAVQSSAGSATELGQGSSAAQAKTRSYPQVVSSEAVLGPVIEKLHLHETASELAQRVSASAAQNSVLIDISVVDPDPRAAARIADAIGASFRSLITNGLEKPIAGGQSLVRVETIQPAVIPGTPSAPQPSVAIALGVFGGVIGGIALALSRQAVDTRVRGKTDIEAVTSAAVLGEIRFDGEAELRPLIVHADPRSPLAESYRALRTSLLFVGLDGHRKSLVLTSAMPNEGKTTTVANLAIALAESGASVALVDADLRRSRLASTMGVEGAVGLADLLIGQAEIGDVAQPWGEGSLVFIPAGQVPPNPSEMLGSEAMRALVADLEQSYDYVLFDTPPLLPVTDAAVLSKLTGGAIVVSAQGRTRQPQLARAIADLESLGARVLGTVLTMAQHKGPAPYGYGYGQHYGYGADGDGRRSKRSRREAKAMRRRAILEEGRRADASARNGS